MSQYYNNLSMKDKRVLEAELVWKCMSRSESQSFVFIHQGYKIVYRRYVSLFFIIGVSQDDEVK